MNLNKLGKGRAHGEKPPYKEPLLSDITCSIILGYYSLNLEIAVLNILMVYLIISRQIQK
jgi:hypothetical protein